MRKRRKKGEVGRYRKKIMGERKNNELKMAAKESTEGKERKEVRERNRKG